jgi:RNA polymerase sigma-70 factor (ECF subfamily)
MEGAGHLIGAKEFPLTADDPGMDAAVLQRCREGDLAAFESLYAAHGERMKSIAANLLGNVSDAEDAVQETFLKVYRAAGAFRGGSSVSTWIYRILVNACYDALRRSRRRPETPLPPRGPAVEAAGTDHPLRLALETAIRRLDPRERASFLLVEVEGFSHREAAEILGIPEPASRALLFKAKKRLRRTLAVSDALRPAEAS